MKEQQTLFIENIAPDDWKSTPEPVKQLVEVLLAKIEQRTVLLEDQSRLTQFLDATPIGIAVHDSTGQLAYVNHVGQELLGIDRRSEPQTNLLPEIFQVYRTSSQELYSVEELPSSLALAGKTVQVDDLEIHRADQVMPIEVWATPIFDDRGQVEYAIAAFQDTTERVRSEAKRYQIEQALAASEHGYRQVVQAQSDFILRSLPDTTITFANDAMCRALGQSLEQVTGQKWSDFAYAEDLPSILQKITTLSPDSSSFVAENRDRRADDQEGWTQWLNQGIFNDQGHLIELQSVGRDITVLKQTEAALRKSEERYRQVVETMLEGIWIIDIKNTTTYVNPHMAEMLGYTAGEMMGENLFYFMDETEQAIAIQNLDQGKQGFKAHHDFRFKTKTGQDLWALISTNPLHDDAGNYIGALATVADITQRKQAEAALERSEQRFRNLFESTPKIAVQGYNRHRQVIYWNDASEQLYGYSKAEALGQQLEDLIIPPEMRPAVITAVQSWLTENRSVPASELSLMHQDGSRVAVYSSHTMLTNPDGELEMYCVDIDLSDRNQAEAALRESETTNRAILSAFPDLLFRVQRDGTCHDFTPPTDAPSNTFLPIQQHLAEVLPSDLLQHFLQRIAHSLTTGELQVWEHQILKYDRLCDEEIRLVPCGTDECLVVVRDITDRKRAEVLLNQREQEFRTLAENAPDIIVRSDRDLRYRYVNPAIKVATGLLPQDFIGKTGYEVGLPATYVALWDTAFTRAFTTGEQQHLEFPFSAPDGMKEYQVRFVPEIAADGSVVSVLAIAHDTTEQKQLEQALRQRVDQEQTLRRVLQAIRRSLSLNLIFRTATAEVAELVQADRTAVVQYLPERQCWKHVSEYRKSLDIPNTLGVEIPDQDNPLAEQLKQFKVVRIDNPDTLEDDINQEFAQIFPGSWLLVPLIVDQKLWGSFSLFRAKQTSPWTEEEANLVQTIADQLAIAIQQAQAFERAQTEIAERQQAEADLRSALSEKEVLLKEIHHRVKNNLQIVSGLLQLQAQSLQDSPAVQALRESQNRIESMSLIHKKLYIASDLEQIDAADYIQSLATSLLTTYKVSPGAIALQVDVEPVILSLDQGIPCGLIINELVSNALKYAFPTNQPGEIRIQLRQIGHELELIIQDNGIGLPDHLDLTNIQSLGLSLVHALSTEQLEGSLTVDRSQGTTFKIRFPQSAS